MAMFGFLKKKGGKEQDKVPSAPDAPPPPLMPGASQEMPSQNIPSLDIPNIKLPDQEQPSFDAPSMDHLQAGLSQNQKINTGNIDIGQQPENAQNTADFSNPTNEDNFSMKPKQENPDESTEPAPEMPGENAEQPKQTMDMPPIKPVDFDHLTPDKEKIGGDEGLLKEPEVTPEATTLPGLPEAMDEPTSKQIQEPAPEPMQEPVPEPMQEPVPEPMQEPAPEPMQEPAPEPMQEPATEPPQEMDYFDGLQQEVEPAKKTESSNEDTNNGISSKRIINDSMYINLDNFREVVELINNLGNESKMADETLLRVKDITMSKEKVYDKWQVDMELVERELIQLDKLLFKI